MLVFLVELVVALNNAMEQWSYSNCDVIESGALTIAMRNSMNAAPNLDVMHRLMLIMLAISDIISLRYSDNATATCAMNIEGQKTAI